jgi:hypothetical protein
LTFSASRRPLPPKRKIWNKATHWPFKGYQSHHTRKISSTSRLNLRTNSSHHLINQIKRRRRTGSL